MCVLADWGSSFPLLLFLLVPFPCEELFVDFVEWTVCSSVDDCGEESVLVRMEPAPKPTTRVTLGIMIRVFIL